MSSNLMSSSVYSHGELQSNDERIGTIWVRLYRRGTGRWALRFAEHPRDRFDRPGDEEFDTYEEALAAKRVLVAARLRLIMAGAIRS